MEAEVAGVGRGEGGEDGLAAAVVEEDLVAEEDVAGLDLRGGDFGDEAVGGGEGFERPLDCRNLTHPAKALDALA